MSFSRSFLSLVVLCTISSTVFTQCLDLPTPSIPRAFDGGPNLTAPGPQYMKIVQTPDLMVALHEFNGAYRQLFMDGRLLQEDPNPIWNFEFPSPNTMTNDHVSVSGSRAGSQELVWQAVHEH